MRKIILILSVIALFFAYSCNEENNSDDNQNDTNQIVVTDDNIDDNNNDVSTNTNDVNTIELKAKFNGIYLSSGGAGIMFEGEDGNDYDFYDDGNTQVHDVFNDVDPTVSYDQQNHFGEWYDITYKKVTKTFYDGYSGQDVEKEVLVIVTIEAANGTNSTTVNNGITLQTLQNCVFFGNQNYNWTIKFKADGIEYTPNIGENPIMMYYYPDKNSCFNSVSAGEVQVKATFDMDRGYISTFTIKKETCSDGESDIDYPYSMHIQWEDDTDTGCGRDL